MELNYKLYSSFIISTTLHLILVAVLSMMILPKTSLPKPALEIELVKVKPPPPPVVIKKKIRKVAKAKKKVKKVKKKVRKTVPLKRKPHFKYRKRENESRYFSEITKDMSSKHITKEDRVSVKNHYVETVMEDIGQFSSIKEQRPDKSLTGRLFSSSALSGEMPKKVKLSRHIPQTTSEQSSINKKLDITWERGVNRKRISSPPTPKSKSSVTGKVIIEFWVDGAGFVVKARPKKRLTSKQDQLALNYVRDFVFEPDSSLKIGERHRGSISILFENVY